MYIKTIESNMGQLITAVNDGRFTAGSQLLTLFAEHAKAIENAIRKRFGLNVHIVGTDKPFGAAIMRPIAPNNNILSKDAVSLAKKLKQITATSTKDADSYKDIKRLEDINEEILVILKKQSDKLKELYNGGKIKVDRKRKFVTGADHIEAIIMINVVSFADADFSPAELTAITLHEIGHFYDTFAYISDHSSRMISTCDDITGREMSTQPIDIVVEELSVFDVERYTNSEHSADNFVASLDERYAMALGNSLTRGGFLRENKILNDIRTFGAVSLAMVGAFLLPIILFIPILVTAYKSLMISIDGTYMTYDRPHGDKWSRLENLRRTLIANLNKRENTISKEKRNSILAVIDAQTDALKNVDDRQVSLNYISDMLKNRTQYIGMKILNQKVTAVTNNNIRI